jgi:hypothetical protein
VDLDTETLRWVKAEIITEEQRQKILALDASAKSGVSLAVLAILWVGGSFVFLGLASLLGLAWDGLGPIHGVLIVLVDILFFASGTRILRSRPELEKTAMALLVIGALFLPVAIGVPYTDIFGSSHHLLPLFVVCGLAYAAIAWRLRSIAFTFLACVALALMGEEVVREGDTFGKLFPLVQLGVVDRLDDVFPVVFFTLAIAPIGLSWLARRSEPFHHLKGTLFVCGLLIALPPALLGQAWQIWSSKPLMTILSLGSTIGAVGLSVLARERKGFWLSGAGFAVALLILFGNVIKDSIAFIAFAIFFGLVTMGLGAYLATRKDSWIERLFATDALRTSPPPET